MTGCGWPAVWRVFVLSQFSSRFVLSGVALCVCQLLEAEWEGG
jgi:hypothetical protein